MHVVATAGHVDHGKSALVRALTGRDPDRLAQERQRGLTIELGYVWTALPAAGEVAFVDVPGHERFISTTLAGLGPVPVVLFVVAADDPWMPQAAEHLAALDALGVNRGLLVVTRTDLADPTAARMAAREQLGATSLRDIPDVAVSARTGAGMTQLRETLDRLLAGLPPAPSTAPARLWVDRSFVAAGAGTIVTGTLPAGTVTVGEELTTGETGVRVRGVETLGRQVPAATGPARVALNLTAAVARGAVLTPAGRWHHTTTVDVRLRPTALATAAGPPRQPLLHIGASTMAVRLRRLGERHARLHLPAAMPLWIGDRGILRDPGTRSLWGMTVLDPAPPPLRGRGAGVARAAELATVDGNATVAQEVARRGLADRLLLQRIGVPIAGSAALPPDVISAGEWLISREHAMRLGDGVLAAVREHATAAPLQPGLTPAGVAAKLGLPAAEIVAAVLPSSVQLREGRVVASDSAEVAPPVARAVAALEAQLGTAPFAAPTAEGLQELGFTDEVLGAAVRAGLVLRLDRSVVLAAGADDEAATALAELPQPFTVSQARQRLATTRRVVLPLLAHLDRTGRTRRLADDRRRVTGR